MPAKQIIERHITQGPYVLNDGETIKAKRFIATGSVYGRMIFTERAPMISIPKGARNVSVEHCDLIGMPRAF